MAMDMILTLTKIQEPDLDTSCNSVKSEDLKEYLDLPERLLAHILSLKDKLSKDRQLESGSKHWDGESLASCRRSQEESELGLKACPLLQSFWNTQRPSDIQQAYGKTLLTLMAKSMNMMDASPQVLEHMLDPRVPGPATMLDVPSIMDAFQVHLTSLIQASNVTDLSSLPATSDKRHHFPDDVTRRYAHALTSNLARMHIWRRTNSSKEVNNVSVEMKHLYYTFNGLAQGLNSKYKDIHPKTRSLRKQVVDDKPLDLSSESLEQL